MKYIYVVSPERQQNTLELLYAGNWNQLLVKLN